MDKNTAGKWVVFAFNRTTNAPLTGDAANITANIRIDGGAANAVDDTNPTELEDGFYIFDVTAAETNGTNLLMTPASTTSDIQVIGCPAAVNTLDIPTNAEFNARTQPTADYFDPAADTVANVTLVATTTTNTDMRGTDSASTLTAAQVNTEVDTALSDIHLDHLLAVDYDPASKPGAATALLNEMVENDAGVSRYTAHSLGQAPSGTGASAVSIRQEMDNNSTRLAAIETDTGTDIPATLTNMSGSGFLTGTDSLEAIRDRGDSAWTTGAGGSAPTVGEIRTELETNGGKLDHVWETTEDDAGVRRFSTNALEQAPSGTGMDAAETRTALGMASANMDTQLGDIPTVSEFNARTLPVADYFDPAIDTVANVTLVGTTTTNTDMVSGFATSAALATVDGNVDDISTRIPAALSTGRMVCDAEAISSSTDAADRLEASAETIVPATVNDAAASTTSFITDLASGVDDFYNGRIVIFTSGALANQASDITDYTGSTKTVTVTALTTAPANSSTFVIV